MAQKVYVNVADHKLKDKVGGKNCEVEDITSVVLPTVSHPTIAVDSAGMAGSIDMPNQSKLEAMEFTINHNNGTNCPKLLTPGLHKFDFRLARHRYNVGKADLGVEGVRYEITAVHKSTEHGTVEAGNPLGSTERYSVTRFVRYIDDKEDTVADIMNGLIKLNGKDCVSAVKAILG